MRKILYGIGVVLTTIGMAWSQPVDPKGDVFFAKQQYQEALDIYAKIENGDSSKVGLSLKLGVCYQKLNQPDKAISEYGKVVGYKSAANRFKAIATYNIATVYSIVNNKTKAFEYLKAAIALGGVIPESIKQDSDFDNIRTDDQFDQVIKEAEDMQVKRAFPCRGNLEAGLFNFWVGEWNVYPTNAPNQLVGVSKVEHISGECAILENWTPLPFGVGPGGKSFNFYNPQTKKWEQHWVAPALSLAPGAGVTKYDDGEYKDGAMRFTFTQTSPNGKSNPGRFIFFNLGPDKVRQLNEVSNDGGTTWTPVYDFIYIRKK